MSTKNTKSQFSARLMRPENLGKEKPWAFVVLPKEASGKLPRRGRVSVDASINGKSFRALLEPDGQKSHWLKIDEKLMKDSDAGFGDSVEFSIEAVEQEPEPAVPTDLAQALRESPEALATWESTTTIARLDWIHWITTAKQEKTRIKRIADACDMLGSGKKRVCCFDPSGFYSKAFGAPKAAD